MLTDWLDLALAVGALCGAVVALIAQRATSSKLRAARRLAADWVRTADRQAARNPIDAERLRYCAYWLLRTLAGDGPGATRG